MQHNVLLENIVQNLTFEVNTMPNNSDAQIAEPSGRTPVKVKVKIRKKDKAGVHRGLISVPEKHASGTFKDKIRVVSSDQTITSFDMFLEAEQKLPMKKHRNKFFDLLRPGICLGNQSDDKDYYLPRNSQNAIGSITSKSDGVLKPHLPLSKNDYIDASTALSKKNPYFLGKCKPGGCLDPPFSEDKYSYIPSKKQSPVEPSTIASKCLYLADGIGTPKQLSDPTTTSAKHKCSLNDSTANEEVLSQEYLSGKSIQKLYQAESVNTSLSITYSNSIITYPPPLTPSEIRLNNEKNTHHRGSTDSKTKRSYDLPQTYFMPPREIINQFDSKYSSRSKINPKGENASSQESYLLKAPSDINNVLAEDMGDDVPGITTGTLYQIPQHFDSSNVDIEIAPVVDDIAIMRVLEEYNSIAKDETSYVLRDSIKENILESSSPISQQQHELKSHIETPKLGSFVRKSIETEFKPSVKSSLADTNLILHKISSGLLIPKDNEIFGKTVDILPLSLEESDFDKRTSIQTSFPKINTLNLQKSSDIKSNKDSCSPLQQNFVENSKSCEEINYLQKEPMEIQNKLESPILDPTEQMLSNELDTIFFNIREDTKDQRTVPQRDVPSFVNDIEDEPSYMENLVSETICNGNDDIVVKETRPTTNQIPKLSSSEEEKLQIEHSSEENTTCDLKTILRQKDIDNVTSNLSEENYIFLLLDDGQLKNKVTLAPDMSSKDKLKGESLKPSVNKMKSENGADRISVGKKSLDTEPLLHSNIDKSTGSDEHFGETVSPTSMSMVSLPKQSEGLLRDQLTKIEKLDQIVADRYKTDDLKRKGSQIIPDFDEPFRDIKKTANVPTIEDAYPLEQETDLSQQNIEITLKPLLDSKYPDKLASGSKEIIQSEEDFKADDKLSSGIYKNDNLINIDTYIKSTESVDKFNGLNSEDIAKIYPQHLLDNKENQFTHSLKKDENSKLDSFVKVPQQQSSTQLFRDELKPLQEVYKTVEPSNVYSDIIVETKVSSKILQDTDQEQKKENELYVPVKDNTLQLKPSINKIEDLSRETGLEISNPTKNIFLETELGKPHDTTASIEILKKPLDGSNTTVIEDAGHGPSLTQNIPSEEDKFDLGNRDQQTIKTEYIKPIAINDEYEKLPSEFPNLKVERNAMFLGDTSIKYDEPDAKSFRTSTMFDVLAIPDPKKLKGEIATLKSNTVLYTPSKTTLPEVIKKDSVTVDIAFHSYINENNESVLRTFNSDKEPQRFPDDRIIIIKSDINLNNEIKIPIDYARNLIVQLKRANESDHYDQQHVFKDADHSIKDKSEENNLTIKFGAETDNSMTINLQSVYEKELLPLQSAIKELKYEIDYLQRHNLVLKDNLLTRKSKPMRLTNVKRCVCLKRIH